MSEDKPTEKKLKHLLMWPVFHLYLKPLIKRNYKLRALGKLPDEWYWADEIACNYGYFVSDESMNMWKRLAALLRKKANSMRRRRAVTEDPPNHALDEAPMFIPLPLNPISRAEFLKLYPQDVTESSEESAEGAPFGNG